MKAEILRTLTAQLVHLGAMPGEAEIMANYADNELQADATFAQAFHFIKITFEI